jgi:hypothetical protein
MPAVALPWDEQPGQPNNITHVMDNDKALRDKINGNLDADNLSPAEAVRLGLSVPGTVRRGKSIIATEEARTNTAYGLLATPDRVSSVVVPADGLLAVKYSALVKNSVDSAARVAIFVGATQQQKPSGTGAPVVEDSSGVVSTDYGWIATAPGAIVFAQQWSSLGGAGDATRPAAPLYVGGPVYIEVPAGTYDVSVQYAATSGTVTAKERKLWVWGMGF